MWDIHYPQENLAPGPSGFSGRARSAGERRTAHPPCCTELFQAALTVSSVERMAKLSLFFFGFGAAFALCWNAAFLRVAGVFLRAAENNSSFMNACVIEVIYITRSWSPFTSICHPTHGSLCSWAISPGALVGGEGGARAARRPRRGRRLRPVMPPWLAWLPEPMAPPPKRLMWLCRGEVSAVAFLESRSSPDWVITAESRTGLACRAGRLLVATLRVLLAHDLGPANANTSGSHVSVHLGSFSLSSQMGLCLQLVWGRSQGMLMEGCGWYMTAAACM